MPLTTSYPPPAGIYWSAAVYASATFGAHAQYGATLDPHAYAHFHLVAKYGMRPPRLATFRVSARLFAEAGTHDVTQATFHTKAVFGAQYVPDASAKFAVRAVYSASGAAVEAPPAPPQQLNAAVTRAATI